MWWRGPLPRLPRPHPFVDFFWRSDSAKRHILGCGDPGVRSVTPEFKLGQDFCTTHLAAKIHYSIFNSSEVIMLTNRQTNRHRWKHPPRCAMLRWWVVNPCHIQIAVPPSSAVLHYHFVNEQPVLYLVNLFCIPFVLLVTSHFGWDVIHLFCDDTREQLVLAIVVVSS